MLEEDLVKTSGKTPEATLYAQVIQENARAEKRGCQPRFMRHGKGLVGLAEWLEPGIQREIAKHNAEAEQEMLQQLRALEPADFEQLVGELLRTLGSETSRSRSTTATRASTRQAYTSSRKAWS